LASGETPFEVEVLTPEGEVFNGEVVQVSTRTMRGEIGVLANHSPVLAALKPTELRLYTSAGSEPERYAQAHGMMQVFGNKVQILVEEALSEDELDTAKLQEEHSDAEQRFSEADEGSAAQRTAQKDLDRTEAFLKIAGADSGSS
jgi:F-type H+-transporting ATPase subunit epsilon